MEPLLNRIAEIGAQYPTRIALGETQRTISYAALPQHLRDISAELGALGIHRLGIYGDNTCLLYTSDAADE